MKVVMKCMAVDEFTALKQRLEGIEDELKHDKSKVKTP